MKFSTKMMTDGFRIKGIKAISSDSKEFIRQFSSGKSFRAVIGVSLSFSRPHNFLDRYLTFFEKLKSSSSSPHHFVTNPRIIFKSSDLSHYFGENQLYSILGMFMGEVISHDDIIVNFVYSSFKTPSGKCQKPMEISKCRWIPFKGSLLNVFEFLNKLASYYSYIPTWKVISSANIKGSTCFIDAFSPGAPYTNAWLQLIRSNNNIRVYPSGDSVNPFISAADLVLRYIELHMLRNNVFFDIVKIKSSLNTPNLRVYHAGTKDLIELIPYPIKTGNLSYKDIPAYEYYSRPIILVVAENSIKKESVILRKSPYHQYLLHYAYLMDASLKMVSFDGVGDRALISGDGNRDVFLVSTGPVSNKIVHHLVYDLGFDFDYLSLQDLSHRLMEGIK
ncbi:hypothetical protein [Thermococcus sp.]|uniref:hypothetical protein n=1 Tax=Thermococcus sp. TaxID=35749 RepID=UPI002614C3F1|nr:hypothetical protein [Thermococcus sp.]